MIRCVPLITTVAVFALGASAQPPSADWPLFRGDGVMRGLAAGSLPDQPKLLWTFRTEGPVKSSTIVVGDSVYFGADDRHVYSLHRKTGAKQWSYATEGPIEAPPAYRDGVVYIGSIDGYFYALDARTGELKWRYTTGDKICGGANFIASPDGLQQWVLVGSYDFKLHCVEAATGKGVWTYATENYVNATPVVLGHRIAFGGCDAIVHIVNAMTGKAAAQIDIGSYIAGTAAADGSMLYLGHYGNKVISVDIDAERVTWSYEGRKFPYFSSPALTEDRLVIGGRDRHLHCINRNDGSAIWQFGTRGRVDSSPVVCGDKVVFGSMDGRIYLVRLTDGKEVWSYDLGRPVMTSPAVVDGFFVVGCDDGGIYAFGGES